MKPSNARPTDAVAANALADFASAKFAIHGQLASVNGENILFSASQRAIFTLNDTAADIWRSLNEGNSPKDISVEMARAGVAAQDADDHVAAALVEWERLGLIRLCLPTASPDGQVKQVVALHGTQIRIEYPPACAHFAAEIFRHLEVQETTSDVQIHVVERHGRIDIYRNGDWVQSCAGEVLPTALKGHLLSEILARDDYALAIHGAALLADQRLLLLCGSPGAGKTTLTLALASCGFGFAGDDVTLLDSFGNGIGLPFAPAVKSGAWPILVKYCPGLELAPVFRRPDRKRVRYPVPDRFVAPVPHPIGWVLLLNRQAGAPATLDRVDPADALRGLLNGSFTPGCELDSTGFEVLTRVIGSADVYLLTYSALEDAVGLIRKTCR